MMRNLLPSKRIGVFLLFLMTILVGIGNVSGATRTSSVSGNWYSPATWGGSAVPTSADDVIINHIVTIDSGEYSVNSITINGKLTVNGTLTIAGNLSTDVDGEFVLGANAVVIVKGDVLLGNKCTIDLSSYLIVLGNFTKSGSDNQGSITANDAHIYILGTTVAPDYFLICDEYLGTTTNTAESSCDGGTFDALVTNETDNPNPIVNDIVQQVTSSINQTANLLPAPANFCTGGSVSLTINESRTIDLLKWFRGTTLLLSQNLPQSPYSYSADVADSYYALYKVIVNNTDVWHKTNSTVVSNLGSAPSQPGAITGAITQCAASINQIYNIGIIPNATSYTWTVPTGWIITEGAGSNSITVTTGSSGQNGNVTVTANNSCGTSSAESLPVTVNPNLSTSVSIQASATTICAGTSVTFTATAGDTGGGTLNYDFKIGGISVQSGASNSFPSTILSTGNEVTCEITVTGGSCLSSTTATSNKVTMTVDPESVGGTISGSATVCTGTNSTTLTLSAHTGDVIKWQSSTASDFSVALTDISNTTTSLTATNLSTTTYYRAVVQNGACTTANSSTGTVMVDPESVGGTISGSATVCTGTNNTILTLSGHTGNVIKWQSSDTSDFSASVTDISNTTTILTATDLATTAYYRAVVQSGVCAEANSSMGTVTVDPLSVGGTISDGATVCSGTNSTTLTLSGNTGIIIKWQSSTVANFSSSVTDISNSTTSLSATDLTTTTYYRAVVQSGVCAEANSSTETVMVDPESVGGTISGSATVCTGTNNTTLTLSGKTGTVIKWQLSATFDFSASVIDISNTTTSLIATDLTTTTYYRAVVQSGVCAAVNSSTGTITVTQNNTVSAASSTPTLCINTALNAISHTTTEATGIGAASNLPAGVTAAFTSNTVTISGTPTASGTFNYSIPLTGGCGTVSATGTITVNLVNTVGAASSTPTLCINTALTAITHTTTGATGIGAASNLPAGVTAAYASNTVTISGTPTTSGTFNYSIPLTGGCGTISATGTITVAVLPTVTPGGPNNVCQSATPSAITLSGASVGGSATTGAWSITSGGGLLSSTAQTASPATVTYTPAVNYSGSVTLTLTTNGSGACSATSGTRTINVNPISAAPTTTGGQICIGTTVSLSASGALVGDKYKWYSSASGGTLYKTSTNNTDNTYTTPTLGSTTNYWVSILSAGGCESSRTQVTATFPATSPDIQSLEGTNSWIGHVYYGTSFNTYFGYYTIAETFDQNYGGNTNCFNINSSLGSRKIYTETFSVRYRMKSTKKGLYVVNLGSDDGSRLTVDETLIHNDWGLHGFVSRPRILMNLTGASSLVYDYYENNGGNRVVFQLLTLVLANNLSTNATQTICIGNSGSAISGDVYGTLPIGISLSGTGYQWSYSTTSATGPWTDITGATSATYTPSSASAPFNNAGTYYIIRKAKLLSVSNNIGVANYVATNESNAATITIDPLPTAYNITGGGAYCAGGSGVAVGLDNSQTGVNYQLYNGASTVGSPVAGTTGSVISFGSQTAAGSYTVRATNATTFCEQNMTGNAIVAVKSLPSPTLSPTGTEACADDDVIYTTQSGQSSYVWNVPGILNTDYTITDGGIGSSNYTVTLKWLTSGSKTVTVNYSDGNGCFGASAASATTTVNPIPVIGNFN